jgi:hypothetical protein
MPNQTIALPQSTKATIKNIGAVFAGDTVSLQLVLDSSYQSKVATFAVYLGSPNNKLAGSNILPAFTASGNLTVTLPAIINGQVTIDLEASQTAYLGTLTGSLGVNQPFALEIQIDVGGGVINTYGIYEFGVEQNLVAGAIPGIPYDYLAPVSVASSATINLNFASGNYFTTNALANNATLTFSNPKFGRVISYQTTNSGTRTRPVLPANCNIYADTWDTTTGAVNLITIQCRNETTPSFDVTFNNRISST